MDIWKWVHETEVSLREDGQARLAHIMDRVPTLTCNDKHDEVDALMPEGLALAKQLNMPWVTLFLRHWHMQSAILHRYDVKERLDDVIDLLDFAHQEQNSTCPQSVCTTQDVAVAYSLLDGKGYVQERLDVAKETLDRIDPTWPCFTCISCEYANALIDNEAHEEAEVFLRQQMQALKDAGHFRWFYPELASSLVDALVKLGRHEDALAALDEAYRPSDSDHRKISAQIDRARVLARLGRMEEAIEALPAWQTVEPTPSHYEHLADALFELMQHEDGLPNHWGTASLFTRMTTKLLERGVYRKGIQIAHQGLQLALMRPSFHLAQWYLDVAEQAAKQLRDPSDFDELHDQFADHIDACQQTLTQLTQDNTDPLPEDAALHDHLTDNPEVNLWILSNWPTRDDDTVREQASAYQAMNLHDKAIDLLKGYLDQCQDTATMVWVLAEAYEQANRVTALQHFLRQHIEDEQSSDELKAQCHYLLSSNAGRQKHWQEAKSQLEQALVLKPDIPNWQPLMSSILQNLGEYEEALVLLSAYIEAQEEPNPNHHWDRMTLAVLAKQWSVARASARALGWEFEDNDEPMFADFGICRITFVDEPEQPTYWAQRLSPVTAQIISMAAPTQPQHFEDMVVFEAVSYTPRPENHPEDEPHYDTFHATTVIEDGQHHATFALDGFHPGDEALQSLMASLSEHDVAFSQRSDEQYKLPWEGEPHLALYAYMCVPKTVALTTIDEVLKQFAKPLRPLVWPTLALAVAQQTGDRQHYERQRQLMEAHHIRD